MIMKIRQRGWEYSHNVTAAILVFQTNPVRVGLFSYVKNFFCSRMLATRLNTFYTKNVKFGRDLLAINEEYRYAKSPLEKFVWWGQICVFTTQTSEKFHFACYISSQFHIFFPLFSKHSQEIHEN